MKYFKLPDLGEGLTEAEIREWHVRPGDRVEVDQPLVSVETAKAIVEVPCPQAGVIASLFGDPGDIIHTGEPLVEFEGEDADSGTVVGEIERGAESAEEDHFIIGSPAGHGDHVKATPAVRSLARRLNVDIVTVTPTGRDGMVTAQDVERAHRIVSRHGQAEPLRGVRRAMAANMARSHAEVVPVSLFEDADVGDWGADEDTTIRLVRAIGAACLAEPSLNCWFDSHARTRRVMRHIDLGIAVDTGDGLFVPVLRDVANRGIEDLRTGVERLRADVRARTIPPEEMTGATITLTNFGTIGGRYGTPAVIPPMVAILGAGVIREEPRVVDGAVVARRVLPLSVTFDHRVVTGGEAARFLNVLVAELSAPGVPGD